MMQSVLIYAFAAAVLGGIDSPVGAVVGGLLLGVGLNLHRDLRRLHRRRAAPAGGAARDPRRPPRPPGRPLRQARGEEGLMQPRHPPHPDRLRRRSASSSSSLPAFVNDFRAQQFSYVGIYLVALIGLNILTGYTGQISLGHGAFMAIGGYTTAILMTDHGVKDIGTIPIAIVVAGVAGFLFGLPAARLSGLYLALATFAIAVATPAVIKRFEGFTGGGSGVNLFGTPELTASLTPVRIARLRAQLQQLALLPGLDDRAGRLRDRLADPARADGPCLPGRARQRDGRRLVRRQPRPRRRRSPSGSAPPTRARRGRCSRSRRPTSTPTRSRWRSRSSSSSASSSPASARCTGLIVGAIFIQFMPLWAQNISKSPGAPAVVYGAFLILVVLALPGGAAGLICACRRS